VIPFYCNDRGSVTRPPGVRGQRDSTASSRLNAPVMLYGRVCFLRLSRPITPSPFSLRYSTPSLLRSGTSHPAPIPTRRNRPPLPPWTVLYWRGTVGTCQGTEGYPPRPIVDLPMNDRIDPDETDPGAVAIPPVGPIPSHVGRYRVEKVLGEGGFGR